MLGSGFLESVYENALAQELSLEQLQYQRQVPIIVSYKSAPVGKCILDMVVEDKLVVELKAVDRISAAHQSQLIHYLRASRLPIGLLLNFGRQTLQIKRMLNGYGPQATL